MKFVRCSYRLDQDFYHLNIFGETTTIAIQDILQNDLSAFSDHRSLMRMYVHGLVPCI